MGIIRWMGRLREIETGREMTLLAHHLVGRDERSDLVITDTRVSMGHASIRWNGLGWCVRDMGSTNRTFVNGRAVARGESQTIRASDRVDFGTAAIWELTDESPPRPTAILVATGEHIVSSDDDVLELAPGLALYRGQGDVWHTRDGRLEDDFREGEEVVLAGNSYRLSLPQAAYATTPTRGLAGRSLADITLTLKVSPGEDRIELRLSCDGEDKTLGNHGHNRLVLLLARALLEDQDNNLPPSLAGWRDVQSLVAQTYGELPRLNTEVYRIRKRLSSFQIVNFADFIERDEDQIRLGTKRVQIVEM